MGGLCLQMAQIITAEAMGSIDADVEIDMEISDDEQESSTGRAAAGQVVDGRVINQTSLAGPTIIKSILIS